jgi:hypothetical protein
MQMRLDHLHLIGLQTALALGHDKGHLLALLQALEASRLDRTEVNEHVVTTLVSADEAKALGIVEPLDRTGFILGHFNFPCNKRSRIAAESWSQGGNGYNGVVKPFIYIIGPQFTVTLETQPRHHRGDEFKKQI